MLSILLISGAALAGGCLSTETENLPEPPPTPIIENITPEEAFALIQENLNNPDFVIIDIRTPEEFAEGYIEGAINIDYSSETFRDELDQLDKDRIYLIYYSCTCGHRSDKAQYTMGELNFREVYNMRRGSDQWVKEGYPLVK